MKKILLVAMIAIAGCSVLTANPLSVIQNTKIKTQETASRANLSAIYLAATDFLTKSRKYPALTELDVPARALSNPYHGLNSGPQVPDKITEANSAYIYFGAALNDLNVGDGGKVPFAFEKPGIRPDRKIVVLFTGGKIELRDTKAKNCAEAVAELKKAVETPDEKVWGALENAAKAVDKAE